MTTAPQLTQRLTLYFSLSDTLARPVPEQAYRCSNAACEQHARQYDLVPFQSCPTCYALPEMYETGKTVQAFPDATDFLARIADYIDDDEPFVVSDLAGLPGNIWVYNRDLDWLEEWCDGFNPNRSGVLKLDGLPVNSIMTRAFMGDVDIEMFMDLFQDIFGKVDGKNPLSLHFGLIQYWSS